MKRMFRFLLATAWLITSGLAMASPATDGVRFSELYELLRTNLAGVNPAALNDAAVQGLVRQLAPRVMLDGVATAVTDTNTPLVSSQTVFDRTYGYIRVGRIGEGFTDKFNTACEQLSSSNRIKGLVIDLRFAAGDDYAAAVAAADRFFATERPLLDWGDGIRKSTAKDTAMTVPVAVLINHGTRGAAEAFAGMLQQGRVALLLGTNTAGEACLYREFKLSDGRHLRVATSTVRLGDNEPLPLAGLKPDVVVEVSPEAERVYFRDAFADLAGTGAAQLAAASPSLATGTNRAMRRRINEAELVRAQREGREPGEETNRIVRPELSRPVITDPALARALDLLKALALVSQFRAR